MEMQALSATFLMGFRFPLYRNAYLVGTVDHGAYRKRPLRRSRRETLQARTRSFALIVLFFRLHSCRIGRQLLEMQSYS